MIQDNPVDDADHAERNLEDLQQHGAEHQKEKHQQGSVATGAAGDL